METMRNLIEVLEDRELDAAVAEEVMGWEWATIPEPRLSRSGERWIASGEVSTLRAVDGDTEEDARRRWYEAAELTITEQLPSYSNDIAAAWKVIEKLAADGEWWGFTLQALDAPLETWAAECEPMDDYSTLPSIRVTGDTAAVAICRMALAAVRADS